MDISDRDKELLRHTLAVARASRAAGGSPFGAVLALDGRILAEAGDPRPASFDPTAHPELTVIREYCRRQGLSTLHGFSIYSSVEPCPMCSGAIYWAGLSKVVFSVRQCELQRLSGGPPQLRAETIIRRDGSWTEVVGPVFEDEGLSTLAGYLFPAVAGPRDLSQVDSIRASIDNRRV